MARTWDSTAEEKLHRRGNSFVRSPQAGEQYVPAHAIRKMQEDQRNNLILEARRLIENEIDRHLAGQLVVFTSDGALQEKYGADIFQAAIKGLHPRKFAVRKKALSD